MATTTTGFKTYRKPAFKKMLADDPNLRRWYFNYAKGSMIVADIYLRRLSSFCEHYVISAAEYVRLPKRKMEEMAFDFVQEMETKLNPKNGKNYAPGYIECYLKALVAWARWNRKSFEMKIKIANLSSRPTLAHERVPTNDEVRRVLYADTTSLRTRVSIVIMAFAGCRPEVQGNYLGIDGLRIKDLPELQIKESEVVFTRVPTLVTVRSELSKSRYWYPTFIPEEGCEILKQWLDKRIKEGEKLTPESGIVVSTEKMQRVNLRTGISDVSPFIRTTKLCNLIRVSMRAVGLPWRPYIFRSYFDTMQILAESKGLITHPYVQCFVGHGGDMEATYSTRKSQLPPELLEDMRGAYAKESELLTTRKSSTMSEDRITEKFNRQFLLISGWTEEEINSLGIDLGTIEQERLQELLAQKNNERLGASASGQRVVPISEVKDWIGRGYEFVTKLDETEAIVRLPR